MKFRIFAILTALSFLLPTMSSRAADPSQTAAELKSIVNKIQAKLKLDKTNEVDLAEEIKEFDTLLDKHKDEKTDETAQVLLMKAMLYLEVFHNEPKGVELVNQLKREFPDTPTGKQSDEILENIKKAAEAEKVRAALAEGATFPDFDEKDLAGKSLKVANYKGKVVLVDFWATWCPPCMRELPNVLKTYEKYHGKGFEIIGISLDESEQKLKAMLKEKNMTWQQYFDGKGWGNKVAAKYGIQSIPATFLLNGEGKIIGKDLRGDSLAAAVAKALPKD